MENLLLSSLAKYPKIYLASMFLHLQFAHITSNNGLQFFKGDIISNHIYICALLMTVWF